MGAVKFGWEDKVYKITRVVTVAPVLALAAVTVIAVKCEGVFVTLWNLTYSVFFLCILPLLAYPLQKYIPGFKDKGREGQRDLAGNPFCFYWIHPGLSGQFSFSDIRRTAGNISGIVFRGVCDAGF